MRTPSVLRRRLALVAGVCTIVGSFVVLEAQNWPEWRGPNRDGTSMETNLPESWSTSGENLAWSLPFGGRSAPVVFGNRLYLYTSTEGDISLTRERLVAVDVDTGQVVWEQHFNIYLSDVPQHRAAWASPAVDPATGNIYIFTVGARLAAVSPDGDILWERSLPEEYGAISTHGGRTTTPIIEDGKVILNTLLMGWGDLARPGNRYFAFDKVTGQTVWISAPQARHYDTNYAPPIVVTMDGQKLIIVGGTDGVFHAMQLSTGKPVWSFEVSKRAILNGALHRDGTVYITHGEENIDTTEMGMVAAITPGSGTGALTSSAFKWMSQGFMPTFSSPVMDADRLYSVDNGAILAAYDLDSGEQAWTHQLGTLQKGSPVLADGKMYVGTENGKFFILRPTATGVEVLDEDVLGDEGYPEPMVASPAIADGRIYIVTMGPPTLEGPSGHVYAIGERRAGATGTTGTTSTTGTSAGPVAQVQVFPYEALLDPGQEEQFTLKLFDANGNFIRDAPSSAAQWSVEGLTGTIADGTYTAPASGSAGLVKATVDGVTGQARVRVIPSLPWSYDFESFEGSMPWWTAHLKVSMSERDGSKVMIRARDTTVGRRAKVIMGRPDWSGYTVEADVLGTEARRQRGDIGLINQRYMMVLFGNPQELEIHPWQAANEMTVTEPFAWEIDVWYSMKLRVENQANGTTLVQGKVWPRGEAEPAAWTIEKVDTIGHREGAPGVYGDGYADVFYDNLRVYRNR